MRGVYISNAVFWFVFSHAPPTPIFIKKVNLSHCEVLCLCLLFSALIGRSAPNLVAFCTMKIKGLSILLWGNLHFRLTTIIYSFYVHL